MTINSCILCFKSFCTCMLLYIIWTINVTIQAILNVTTQHSIVRLYSIYAEVHESLLFMDAHLTTIMFMNMHGLLSRIGCMHVFSGFKRLLKRRMMIPNNKKEEINRDGDLCTALKKKKKRSAMFPLTLFSSSLDQCTHSFLVQIIIFLN